MADFDRNQLPDEKLIEACRDGDEGAWMTLVDRYERLVYTVPSRYGLTPAEIDDVFQTVWVSLLNNLDNLREPERVAAWLVTTARRECWEHRRGPEFENTISSNFEDESIDKEVDEPPPEELVMEYRRHEMLRGAIDQLQEQCRRLLWFLYFEATIPSYAVIAEKLDMPIGSIGPMRARCLKKLRAIMTANPTVQ